MATIAGDIQVLLPNDVTLSIIFFGLFHYQKDTASLPTSGELTNYLNENNSNICTDKTEVRNSLNSLMGKGFVDKTEYKDKKRSYSRYFIKKSF